MDLRKGRAEERKRYAGEQIADALRQAEAGTPVTQICSKMGVSQGRGTFEGREHTRRRQQLTAVATEAGWVRVGLRLSADGG